MNQDLENVKQAKASFERVLGNKVYAGIIRDDKHLAKLLDLIKDGSYRSILDIGTGTGYLAYPLAEMFPAANVCGLDIAETVIQENNEDVRKKGVYNLVFQAFDGLKYPFADESFDLIVTRYAFHHFPNVVDAIRQMNRILTKGGRVLVSDPLRNKNDVDGVIDEFMRVKKDGHIRFYSPSELDSLFLENGFVKEKQVLTDMTFPFAPKSAYIALYDKLSEKDRALYDMTVSDGVVWVRNMDVGNTVFVKQ